MSVIAILSQLYAEALNQSEIWRSFCAEVWNWKSEDRTHEVGGRGSTPRNMYVMRAHFQRNLCLVT